MNKKNVLLVSLLMLIGLALRLVGINKPEGLWNDEYVSWMISNMPLGKSFINAIFSQCHMPFYYLYLKLFTNIFGNSDIILRLTSTFAGILAIPAMYFLGKEFSNKCAYMCAFLTTISSFLIYFSQEVRFYEILFVFAALAILFTVKLTKNISKVNLIGAVIFNFLVIFTHSTGFVFVLFNLLYISSLLWTEHKRQLKYLWGGIILLNLPLIPMYASIFVGRGFSQWWSSFSISKIGFIFTDYFSPYLINLVSSPNKFLLNLGFVIFGILPAIIAIIFIIRALFGENKKEILGLFLISACFFFVNIFMAMCGKLVLLTKYTIEIYPILILLMSIGIYKCKPIMRYFLLSIFVILNLLFLWAYPNSAPKMPRAEGHNIVGEIIKNANLKKGDSILFTYYSPERFSKYIDFTGLNTYSIDKNSMWQYLGINAPSEFSKLNQNSFENMINKNIFSHIKKGEKVSIVFLNDVSLYSPVQVQLILLDEKKYQKTPFMFLAFSQIKNSSIDVAMKQMQFYRIESKGAWQVVTFIK